MRRIEGQRESELEYYKTLGCYRRDIYTFFISAFAVYGILQVVKCNCVFLFTCMTNNGIKVIISY